MCNNGFKPARGKLPHLPQANDDRPARLSARIEKYLGYVILPRINPKAVPFAEPALEDPIKIRLGTQDPITLIMSHGYGSLGIGHISMRHPNMQQFLRLGLADTTAGAERGGLQVMVIRIEERSFLPQRETLSHPAGDGRIGSEAVGTPDLKQFPEGFEGGFMTAQITVLDLHIPDLETLQDACVPRNTAIALGCRHELDGRFAFGVLLNHQAARGRLGLPGHIDHPFRIDRAFLEQFPCLPGSCQGLLIGRDPVRAGIVRLVERGPGRRVEIVAIARLWQEAQQTSIGCDELKQLSGIVAQIDHS